MKVHRRLPAITAVALAVALAAATPAGASPAPASTNDAAARPEAALYASAYGVSTAEAHRRLALEPVASDFAGAVTRLRLPTFAGVWLEHEPAFRVVVALTDPAGAAAVRAVVPARLAPVLDVRAARHSLATLASYRDAARALFVDLGVPAVVSTDVPRNVAQVSVEDVAVARSALARAGRALPPATELVGNGVIYEEVDLYGGHDITEPDCSSSWAVVNTAGTKGITTAGHCPDDATYNGTALPLQAVDYGGDTDAQWHSLPANTTTIDLRPYVRDNSTDQTAGYRTIRRTVARTSQVINATVCKFGVSTQFTCGRLASNDSISAAPNSTTTYMVVDQLNPGDDLSQGGDSGSPWFNGQDAYGVHHGAFTQTTDDAVYTAINYVTEGLNVGVMTAIGPGDRLNAGEAIRSPNGNFRATMQGDGNFVVYNAQNQALWASNTAGTAANGYFSMGYDGNFVVNRADASVAWGANTMGTRMGLSYLTLQNDGNLVLVQAAGVPDLRWGTRSTLIECRRLSPDRSLWSPDGKYRMTMQLDGNLVVYNQSNQAVWDSGTAGNSGAWFEMQCDGNAVIYRPGGVAIWDSGTGGRQTSGLTLLNDGTFKIFSRQNTVFWGSDKDTLYPNRSLINEQRITSDNGQYFARMNADGNFVLYTAAGGVLWESRTAGNWGSRLVMQSDGNLVIYTAGNAPIWDSFTQGNTDARLWVTDQGGLYVISPSGSILRDVRTR